MAKTQTREAYKSADVVLPGIGRFKLSPDGKVYIPKTSGWRRVKNREVIDAVITKFMQSKQKEEV